MTGAEAQLGILCERVRATPAHFDPPVALRAPPTDHLGGRQPGIHDHRGARPVAEQPARTGDGLCQRGGFGDVAGQDLAAASEAGRVERQPERDHGAFIAFLLGASVAQVGPQSAVMPHNGQIAEGNRRRG